MFDNEIISPNIKVKKIRKILRLTQPEIANGVCSKSMISQIENNKESLTFIIATGIAENFNKAAKDKNIDIELITAENLIKDEITQANELFEKNIIKELEKIDEIKLYVEKIEEAENLIYKYKILDNKKIELYDKAAHFYYSKHDFFKSDEMCNEGLKICIRTKNMLGEANLYLSKSRNNINRYKYKHAMEQLEHAEKINNYIDDKNLFERIYFNKSLIYKKNKKFDDALKCLKILKNKCDIKDINKLLDIKMLYANCFLDKNDFVDAESEYIEILELAAQNNNKNILCMAYRNLGEVHYKQGNYKDAATNMKESLKNNPRNVHRNETLYFAAKVIRNIKEDVEVYLLEALTICETEDIENVVLMEKIIYELMQVYMENEDETKIMNMVNKTDELDIDFNLIYSELVEYYRDRNKEKSKYFNIKKIKKLKHAKDM